MTTMTKENLDLIKLLSSKGPIKVTIDRDWADEDARSYDVTFNTFEWLFTDDIDIIRTYECYPLILIHNKKANRVEIYHEFDYMTFDNLVKSILDNSFYETFDGVGDVDVFGIEITY